VDESQEDKLDCYCGIQRVYICHDSDGKDP
jgi:hypothetical protein